MSHTGLVVNGSGSELASGVSHGWVAPYTLGFLNAYLKGEAAEMAFLKDRPAAHGVPKHFVSVDFRAASSSP